ncbi:MAG: T9SS type A sorting domain-containing protein [Candidatus Kapaibacterium sp.]
MKKLIYTILLLLIGTALKSAEIIPVWNTTVEGKVQDMDFLKGQNEVLMLVGEGSQGYIQIRNTENGELIKSFYRQLSSVSRLAITPDSLRFIHLDGNGGTLRAVDENFTSLKSFNSTQEDDSVIITFNNLAIDPVRPNVYVTTIAWDRRTNLSAPYKKVIAYNYETGEHIKDLTGYGEDEYTAIEVSHDGKYLATLNDNKAYLKVWNLETMELIINEPLFDVNSDDWCRAEDIYFSKLDENLIYISGYFTKKVSPKDVTPPSIYSFNINTKEREILLPNEIYGGGGMIFLDNETKIFNSNGWDISVLSLLENKLEYFAAPPKNVYSGRVIYSKKMNYFIGSSINDLSKFLYDSQSSVNNTIEEEITITPNPTNSIVSINLNCLENQTSYQINNTAGILIYQNTITIGTESLQIDFTPYPTGVYFLTLSCNNLAKTYKIIKEG